MRGYRPGLKKPFLNGGRPNSHRLNPIGTVGLVGRVLLHTWRKEVDSFSGQEQSWRPLVR